MGSKKQGLSRRFFLASGPALAGLFSAASTMAENNGQGAGTLSGENRINRSYQIRQQAAMQEMQLGAVAHPTNGDEQRYESKIANYSKGLPHNAFGEVDLAAYGSLLAALESGSPADFEAITLGGGRKLTNPQSGLAFDLEGTDCHQLAIPAPPPFASAQQAGEAAELYWMALCRDVPFTDYATNALAQQAAADLSRFGNAFYGPKIGGAVTAQTLFRGNTPGDLAGPFVSQLLLQTAPLGGQFITLQVQSGLAGVDFLTDYAEWLSVQNGNPPAGQLQYDSTLHYLYTARDLAHVVHMDVLYQEFLQAFAVLATMGAPYNPGNPYNRSRTQAGFGTFGLPHGAALLGEVSSRALKAVWAEKWFVHRRLRPEAFGGAVHNAVTGARNYPIDGSLLNSAVLPRVFNKYGSYLLPQAYAEGAPTHPSYGAGHATVAGACVTLLKAFFDENWVIHNPVVSPDGVTLVPYNGPGADALTVGGELNKVAANVAMGRNIAGIHWRTDYWESLKLGEAVTISVLRDQKAVYNENFAGFTFTKFDGTQITI